MKTQSYFTSSRPRSLKTPTELHHPLRRVSRGSYPRDCYWQPHSRSLSQRVNHPPSTRWSNTETFDHLWSYATLYKNEQNPILQEFKLRGRYQGQYWDVDADQGSQSDWEDRRSRFGFDAKLFEKKLEVRADFQSNDGFDDFYDGLVDAYIRWKPQSWLSITAGKTKPLIAQIRLAGIHQYPTHLRTLADFQPARHQPRHRAHRGRHHRMHGHGAPASTRTTRLTALRHRFVRRRRVRRSEWRRLLHPRRRL